MSLKNPARRWGSLLAASSIALSTAVLGVTGVANAADEVTPTENCVDVDPGTDTTPTPTTSSSPSATETTSSSPSATETTPSDPPTGPASVPGEGAYAAGQSDTAEIRVAVAEACGTEGEPTTEPSTSAAPTSSEAPNDEPTPTEVEVASIGAVQNVKAQARTSSIMVTWDAPADDSAVVGYEAFALPVGAQSDADLVSCFVDSDGRACLLGVEAGQAYSVGVYAFDENGELSEQGEFVETSVVPAPVKATSVPAGNAVLEGPSGPITKVTAGQKMTLVGKGYLPFSTVSVFIYSEPTFLANVTADENGEFTLEVEIPANLVNGQHSLVASGVDLNGNPYVMRADFTVTGGVAAPGTSGASAGGLAYTGASVALPVIGGVAALGIGGGLLVASRRRNAAQEA